MALEIPDAHLGTLTATQELAGSPKYSQKFSLQRRDQNGCFKKMETFDKRISPEEALAKFGPGYYILKSCLPRFKTEWKQKLGENELSKELGTVKKKTTQLGFAVAGLTVTEIAGFGLTYYKFSKLEKRIGILETVVMQSIKTTNPCGTCGKPLDFPLQKFCSQCSAPAIWPTKLATIPSAIGECVRCGFPMLGHQVFCPDCGTLRPIQTGYTVNPEANFGFMMVNG